MKPYVYIVLFLLVLLAPFAFRATLGEASRRGAAEGAQRLIVVTPNNQDIRQEFAWAFSAWHQSRYGAPVVCDFRVPGGSADIKRQLEMGYRGARDSAGRLRPDFVPDYDVLWGGGYYFFDQELKPLGVFQPLGLSREVLAQVFPQPTLAGVRLYDGSVDPQWAGVALSSFGIVYSPDLYAALSLPAPQAWSDLTNPRLANFLSLADPTHSGSVAVAYMMVMQRAMADAEEKYLAAHPGASKSDRGYREAIAAGWKRGMSELVLMAANARYFTASASEVPSQVGDGQAAAGLAVDLYARVYSETVGAGRVWFVTPVNATAITPDPVGILAGVTGQRLELARHFVEFLLSREGQMLWALRPGVAGGPRERALRRMPVRRDLYAGADRTGWSDPEENPFAAAGGFNQRGEWMGQFGDLRTIWRAAWIDAREELKAAYGAVLRVGDEGKRDRLLEKLADIPVEMSDLDAIRAERKWLLAGGGDVEEWKARQQIDWAQRFRRHYAAVAEEARHGE